MGYVFLYVLTLSIVHFGWNKSQSSTKVDLAPDSIYSDSSTEIIVRDGKGFKSVFGDIELQSGGKYFYQVKLVQGSLMKIGICRNFVNAEQVSFFLNQI